MRDFWVRTYYIRFDGDRIRIDSPGVRSGFDDLALLATERDGKGDRVVAIGREAKAIGTRPGITIHQPFNHERMVMGSYNVAEKLLLHALRSFVRRQSWTFFRPLVVTIVHPTRAFAGGLTDIERRALIELAENCGARKVAVHQGPELSEQQVRGYEFPIGLR